MSGLRVTAPYLTMKIKQPTGIVVTGFYRHAVVQDADVDVEDRDRLLAKGMLEWVDKEPEPEKVPEPEKPAKAAKSGGGS